MKGGKEGGIEIGTQEGYREGREDRNGGREGGRKRAKGRKKGETVYTLEASTFYRLDVCHVLLSVLVNVSEKDRLCVYVGKKTLTHTQ